MTPMIFLSLVLAFLLGMVAAAMLQALVEKQ
jgi:hypothetical protein